MRYPAPAPSVAAVDATRPAGCRTAFTLVELLVVIGIIALLIGILLPSLSRARDTAQRTACAAQLHSVLLAATLHRNNHHGFYPLAGVVSSSVPELLNDAQATKYDYYSYPIPGAGGGGSLNLSRGLATMTDSLSTEMSAGGVIYGRGGILGSPDEATREKLMLDSRGVIKPFLCPAHTNVPLDIAPQYTFQYIALSGESLAEPQSYIFNEFVVGIDDTLGRLRGQASLVHDPVNTMFVADGFGGKAGVTRSGVSIPVPMYTVYTLTNAQPVSLADAFADRAGYAGDKACFDLNRHKGQINVGFCDGHVESRKITQGGLANVRLNNVQQPQ